MSWINLSPNYKAFLTLLHLKKVDYLLVGGYAVNYYGYLRYTKDLDIWTATHPLNAMKLVSVCQEFGSGILDLSPEPFQHDNRIIRIEIPPLVVSVLIPIIGQPPETISYYQGKRAEQIEILTVQSGARFENCFVERVVDIVDGIEINIISLRHLREIKRTGNRPNDLEDLAHLP